MNVVIWGRAVELAGRDSLTPAGAIFGAALSVYGRFTAFAGEASNSGSTNWKGTTRFGPGAVARGAWADVAGAEVAGLEVAVAVAAVAVAVGEGEVGTWGADRKSVV